MKIGIGFLPKHYYNTEPDAGGFFPFGMVKTPLYVFILDKFYLPRCNPNLIPSWMENIQAFPLYFCAEYSDYWKRDLEKACLKNDITIKYLYKKRDRFLSVSTVETISQLKKILPRYISMGSSNDLVMWSTNKDIFSTEERVWQGNWEGKRDEVPVVKFDKAVSLFWIGYDGDSVIGLSNNTKFSTYENICATLPSFVRPELEEYE